MIDTEYPCRVGGQSGNISFTNFTAVLDCTVKLHMTDPTTPVITVSGTPFGVYDWFFTGSFNNWSLDDTSMMTEVADYVYEISGVKLPESGKFKLTTNGWGNQYGSSDSNPVAIDPKTLSVQLTEVAGESGECSFTLTPGVYDITWDYNNQVVTFKLNVDTAVESVAADDIETVYYNLQGVKVENPRNGIFIKVVGDHVEKVALAK